ncbi:MAG TPA: M48 family metallopeptidase [Bryobacteraceae bacterium]|nr:M48 family metallopeptidase [Bryobacteraceae bacterium]
MLHTRRKVLAVLLLCAVSALGQTKLKPGFNLFSKGQDVELGREAAAEVERSVRLVNDRDLNAYVNQIGRRLAAAPEAEGSSYPYSFKVVHDGSINAFALPGGPTYVNTGLILAAENEAQLAGVMAHEIAHVALRHGTNQASKSMGLQMVAGLVGQGIGGGSLLGQLGQMGIAFGANSVLLKYSRDAERQADLLGARIMSRAGYNPLEMARFFEKLEAQGGARGPEFLSSHPNPGNRVRLVEQELRSLPRGGYGDSGQFQAAQNRVRELGGAPRSRSVTAGRGWRRVR